MSSANPNPLVDQFCKASKNGDLTTVKFLYAIMQEHGIGINAYNEFGLNAITSVGWSQGNEEELIAVAKFLLEHEADVNSVSRPENLTPTIIALREGHMELALLFIRQDGMDPNIIDDAGLTALMFAAKKGDIDGAKALVEAGADLDVVNKQGETAVLIARRCGHHHIADFINEKTTQIGLSLLNGFGFEFFSTDKPSSDGEEESPPPSKRKNLGG